MRSRFFGDWFTVNYSQIYATTTKVQQTQLQLFFFDIDSSDVSCISSQKNKHSQRDAYVSSYKKRTGTKYSKQKKIEYNLK